MNFLFESSIFILGFITQAICAIGSGLIEVLCSPIVEACPFAQFLLLELAWRNPHFHFATCQIEKLVDDGRGMKIRELFKTPIFYVAVILMMCSGASELSMAQWASAFVESGLGFSKIP